MPTEEERDAARATLLAERARQLFLWLRTNDLPMANGLKGRPPGDFEAYAGVYRTIEQDVLRGGGLVAQFWSERKEINRLMSLRIGARHVLFSMAGEALNGRYQNALFTVDGKPLEQEGAIGVHMPVLDSEPADADNLRYFRFQTFVGFRDIADMVYDDVVEATRVHIDKRLQWVFGYDPPREAYRMSIKDIVPVAGMGLREFEEYLYRHATYTNATTVGTGGEYYPKWRAKTPLRASDRVHVPTKLSDRYLHDSFHELVLRKGEDYALVEMPDATLVYQLRERTRKGRKRGELEPLLLARYARLRPKPDLTVAPPIPLVVFHALDGGSQQGSPIDSRGHFEFRADPSGRTAYDYKTAVCAFLKSDDFDAGSDDKWFTTFVDLLFPDMVYPVPGNRFGATLSTLSMVELLRQVDVAEGPMRQQVETLQSLAAAKPELRFVIKGSYYGETQANRRQLIGVSDSQVYEWYPETSLVTRMHINDWYEQNYYGKVINETYEGTKGMIPLIMLVTFGGAAIAGGAVIGAGALVATAGRTIVQEFVSKEAAKKLTKETLKRFRTQLIALVADGLLGLFPRTNDARFEFFRGFVHGFGNGAIDHYLRTVDDRLAHEAKRLYNAALSKATKGLSRAYQVYMKVSSAYHKLHGVFRAVKAVWTEARARLVADGLVALGESIGFGVLVLLFVTVYCDYVYLGGRKEKAARDKWIKAQGELLQLMIRETADDLIEYAKGLRDDAAAGADTLAVRARNEKLAKRIAVAVAKAPSDAPSVVEILRHLLEELGVENVQELLDLGLTDVMTRGMDAMLHNRPGLLASQAEALGSAIGQFIGTLFLERAMLPSKWRSSPITGNSTLDKSIRKTLAGGTSRALWELAKAPIKELRKTIPALAKDLASPPSATPSLFETVQHDENWYRDLLRDVLDSEQEIASTLATIARDPAIEARLSEVKARAALSAPPGIKVLLAGEDPLWPRDVMTFVLSCWLRVGLQQILRAFELLEETKGYDGKFKLATLLEIAGLQVALDDKTSAEMRVGFEQRTVSGAPSR